MAKAKIAVYDTDPLYRERFADYLMTHKVKEIDLSFFSGITSFLEALTAESYQLFILGSGYEEVLSNLTTRQVPILVLTEQNSGKEVREEDANITFLLKYQSMECILHQMYGMMGLGRKQRETALEVIGVFSPVQHEMQMFFSLLYVQKLLQQEKVLYLNFMEFSGFSELFWEGEWEMEDVFLQLREGEICPEAIYDCIYEKEAFAYIPPFSNPENLRSMNGKDFEALLKFVAEYTHYQIVVIDFGGVWEGFAELVKGLTKLYCIGRGGSFYEARMKAFFEYLEKKLEAETFENVQSIELPYPVKGIGNSTNILEQLRWSEFGDFVRSI